MTRRTFVATAGIGALAGPSLATFAQGPQVLSRNKPRAIVISSANGNMSKDAAGKTCVVKAFEMLTSGADVLDAILAGVNIVELDPDDTSVGYGGLPNADGVVQLDASVMYGPTGQGGAVGCLEGVKTPSLVAKKVMEETDHVLLVGKDAQRFARDMGFKIENLNTDKSRRLFLEWKRRSDPEHYLTPKKRARAGLKAGLEMVEEGLIDPDHFYGTINCNALNAKGEIAGATTTSGLAWKIPGRVGDSPILGAGLYVDGAIGAAGSTGRGEANLLSLASFLVVEQMRGGASPKDAGMAALKRIADSTKEKRLLNGRGQPNFNVCYYALNVKGEYAGVTLYAGEHPLRFAVCSDSGPQMIEAEALYPGTPES